MSPFGFFNFDPRMFGRPDDGNARREHVPVRVSAAMEYISRIHDSVTDPPSYGGEFSPHKDPRTLNAHEQASYSAALQLVTRYFQGEQYPDSRAESQWSTVMPTDPGTYIHYSTILKRFMLASASDLSNAGVRLVVFGHEPGREPSGYWLHVPEHDFFGEAIAEHLRVTRDDGNAG